MAVLDPQHDVLAGRGRRQPGVAVGRPRIGVMGSRQRPVAAIGGVGAAIAEGVERVFDDVMPGRADDVQEQLAAKFRQAKARADLAAVEHDACGLTAAAFAPFGQDLAVFAK